MGRNRVSLFLGCAAVALIGFNAYLIATPVDVSPVDVGSETPSPQSRATLHDAPERGSLFETVARPLFAATRKPTVKHDEPEQQAAQQENIVPAHLELRGVMRRGGRMQALIRSGDDPAGHWLPVGGSYGGLVLREIKGDVAVIEAGGQRFEVPLFTRRADKVDGSVAKVETTSQ